MFFNLSRVAGWAAKTLTLSIYLKYSQCWTRAQVSLPGLQMLAGLAGFIPSAGQGQAGVISSIWQHGAMEPRRAEEQFHCLDQSAPLWPWEHRGHGSW